MLYITSPELNSYYNWKCAPFDQHLPNPTTPHSLGTISNFVSTR